MSESDVGGPALTFPAGAPLYLLAFDKAGSCTSPRTRAHILAAAGSGAFSDVHIYAHGWNNVFDEALAHYREFFTEYFGLRRAAHMDDARYQPLIVGLIWPSTALLSENERAPVLAAFTQAGLAAAPAQEAAPAPEAALDAAEQAVVADLASGMGPREGDRFITLASRKGPLDGADSQALAALLAPLLQGMNRDDEPVLQGAGGGMAVTPGGLVRAWGGTAEPRPDARAGRARALRDDVAAGAPATEVEGAGLLSFLNPREIIRKASVYLMKDRAGVVGAKGVHALLDDLIALGKVRLHLTGHSYGAKVVLSAVAALAPGRKVASVLLLQPAVSAYCFAAHIKERGGVAGGYRSVLDKTSAPLFATFSTQDAALTTFYQLALRRNVDLGEPEMGGAGSLYAALGAVGPQGMDPGEVSALDMLASPAEYAAATAGVRICALNGSHDAIKGHGDVRNGYTEWALANLVRLGMQP